VQTPDQEGLYQLNESKDHRVLGTGRVPQLGPIMAVVRHRRDITPGHVELIEHTW